MSPVEVRIYELDSSADKRVVLKADSQGAEGASVILESPLGTVFVSLDRKDTEALVRLVDPPVEVGVLRESPSSEFPKRGENGYVLYTDDSLSIGRPDQQRPRIDVKKTST